MKLSMKKYVHDCQIKKDLICNILYKKRNSQSKKSFTSHIEDQDPQKFFKKRNTLIWFDNKIMWELKYNNETESQKRFINCI
jgi:hypothetical protein